MKSFLQLILEQDEPLSFPDKQITIYPDRQDYSFLIVPTEKSARNIRSIINNVKQVFDVVSINQKEMNTFDVSVDRNQDFDEIIDFVKNEIEKLK